ncbi:MAG: hypothetical protein IKN11_08620 [Bacteroidales bacterium]|nr:hypothetical protein [Bacteroidales bacterium]
MAPEVVGTIAAIVILVSFVLRGEMKIRLLNMVGFVFFVWYSFMISNFVLGFMGVAVVLVHCVQVWHMIKESRTKRALEKEKERAATAEAKVGEQEVQLRSLLDEKSRQQQPDIY